jgi:hypothetical protein
MRVNARARPAPAALPGLALRSRAAANVAVGSIVPADASRSL